MGEEYNETASKQALEEIRKWKLEAREEDSIRYFFLFDDVELIEEGEACFVVGRKGSGKTAIGEHVESRISHDRFVTNLSFKSFPFNALYTLKDDHYTPPSEYITIWKYVIFSAICKMMSKNEMLSPEVTVPLRATFNLDFEKALSQTITRLTEQGGSLNILATGGGTSRKSIVIENTTPWNERVEILEDVINEFIDGANYFVFFDALDEDYSDIITNKEKGQYLHLLISLFKAVQDIRRKFHKTTNIKPVVLLRDDIFELLNDNDKNKWTDVMVRLDWDESSLQKLMAYRISRALDAEGKSLEFTKSWSQVVGAEQIRYGRRGRDSRTPFRHMVRNTLMRPRDVIAYLRECARIALNKDEKRISASTMKTADEAYSFYLRREYVDEIQSVVPDIDNVFNCFSDIRKQIFTVEEFREVVSRYEREKQTLPVDFDTLCKLLFHFSVIGNVPRQTNRSVYRYQNPQARFNKREKICLHRGLLRAVQVY